MRRLATSVGTAVLAGAAVFAVAPAATADPISSCTATTGTIIAVDFSHWGGPMVRGCGAHSATGYQLLHDGGFSTAGDQHDGPAFICRIGNAAFRSGTQYPTPKDDACVLTPPASAYWSYWVAPRGQHTWTYSQRGAMSEIPKPGEVELWQFGGTNIAGTQGRPSISPDQLRARNSAPTVHVAPRTSTGHRPRSSPAHHVPASGRRSIAVRPTTTPAAIESRRSSSAASAPRSAPRRSIANGPTRCPSAIPSSADGSSDSSGPLVAGTSGPAGCASSNPSSGSVVVEAKPLSDTKKPSTGSAAPVVVAAVIALALALGAAVTVLRRRRTGSAD